MTGVDRLVVVRCPDLLDEDEGGAVLRSFLTVIEAVEAYCPWVTTVRAGICSLPARGPARYFGGEERLARPHRRTVRPPPTSPRSRSGWPTGCSPPCWPPPRAVIVPAGGHRRTSSPPSRWTSSADRRAGRAAGPAGHPHPGRLRRPARVPCARPVRGRRGGLPPGGRRAERRADGLRHPAAGPAPGRGPAPGPGAAPRTGRTTSGTRPRASGSGAGPATPTPGPPGPWPPCQALLGPDGVVTARLQGGRGPAERARFVTWNAGEARPGRAPTVGAGAPGRAGSRRRRRRSCTPPPCPAELADADGEPVSVSGRGLLTAAPARLSVEKGPWSAVTAWAGPWPSDERWWSRSRRRSARLQAVTGAEAHLLLVERGRWWVEATYG